MLQNINRLKPSRKIHFRTLFIFFACTFLICRLLSPIEVQAASRVGAGGAASGANATLAVTIPATTTGNTLVAVIGSIQGSNAVTSITGGGAWARAISSISGSQVTEIWYCPNITAGVTSVSINKSAVDSTAIVHEYSGVLATSQLDRTATAGGTATAQSSGTTAATTQANELWIGGFSTGVTGTYSTAASGWTTVRSFGTVVAGGFLRI